MQTNPKRLSPPDWHRRFLQQATWTAELRRSLATQLKFNQMHSILEVGCGSGVITRSLHGLSRQALIYGVDWNISFLRLARNSDPDTIYIDGNANFLPFPDQAFDGCVCHYFLMWQEHPDQILKEMVRITCKGGYLVAFAEPDHEARIDYPNKLGELGQLQTKALKKQGANPQMGRQLAGCFLEAGLNNVHSGVLGGRWGEPPAQENTQNEWEVLEADLADMLDQQTLKSLKKMDLSAWQSGERILYVPTFYAWGQV